MSGTGGAAMLLAVTALSCAGREPAAPEAPTPSAPQPPASASTAAAPRSEPPAEPATASTPEPPPFVGTFQIVAADSGAALGSLTVESDGPAYWLNMHLNDGNEYGALGSLADERICAVMWNGGLEWAREPGSGLGMKGVFVFRQAGADQLEGRGLKGEFEVSEDTESWHRNADGGYRISSPGPTRGMEVEVEASRPVFSVVWRSAGMPLTSGVAIELPAHGFCVGWGDNTSATAVVEPDRSLRWTERSPAGVLHRASLKAR